MAYLSLGITVLMNMTGALGQSDSRPRSAFENAESNSGRMTNHIMLSGKSNHYVNPDLGSVKPGIVQTKITIGSADEQTRAERVASLKAKRAIIAEREGVFVEVRKVIEETTTQWFYCEQEKTVKIVSRSHVITERVEGVIREEKRSDCWRSEVVANAVIIANEASTKK